MITSVLCVADDSLRAALRSALREAAAGLTEDGWEESVCKTPEEREAFLNAPPPADLACCDLTQKGMLDWACRFRGANPGARLLLIAERGMPPTEYLRPQIMASSLLLKPCGAAELRRVSAELLRSLLEAREADAGDCLTLKTRDGLLRLPYERIYFIEAREKKLRVRLLREEYSFYGTLDQLQKTLRHGFVRTHRSFLVNERKILLLRTAERIVELEDGFAVPLSRSYRSQVKQSGGAPASE